MYTSRTGLILGFHGADKSIVDKVLSGEEDLKASENSYDWLGNGIYFWDNSPSRALQWAQELSKRPGSKIKEPAVVGAILDLGYCLDLLDYKNLSAVKAGFELLSSINASLPKNTGRSSDLLLRNLDCAVIETVHHYNKIMGDESFDSVRGVFWEGGELYPGGFFKEKDHIQICVRNIDCIKGYFLPLDRVSK